MSPRAPHRPSEDPHGLAADAALDASRVTPGMAGAISPTAHVDAAAAGTHVPGTRVSGNHVEGISVSAATGSGDDTRRRGWFWHWNSIVTQFAPLIGLKGVGLLNSYTVWTDRREESPHRGYAFPSQQSEADFYGEDRAELITINKILVALNLIEIRKEMVLRTDGQGRRWRVPHNFYRVKDHADGYSLSARDVLAVVALADRDKNAYRYVRHIFSARFSPIDPDNVWERILPVVRQYETWQRLEARSNAEDSKASARTRAGHAARKAGFRVLEDGDTATPSSDSNDSDGGDSVTSPGTSVVSTNNGLGVDVEPANNGSTPEIPTSVAPTNSAAPTSVEQTNRMYNQSRTTTMTTNGTLSQDDLDGESHPSLGNTAAAYNGEQPVSTPIAARTDGQFGGAGPGGHSAPADAPGEASAIAIFIEANARAATPAEQRLLRQLADELEPTARAVADRELPTGWSWVAAAIDEAVSSGSAFVAPRRIREIVTRWARQGLPDRTAITLGFDPGASPFETSVASPQVPVAAAGPDPGEVRPPDRPARSRKAVSADVRLGDAPDFPLPHGKGSRRTWAYVISLVGGAIEAERMPGLFDGTAIVGFANGEATISVPDAAQAERLAGDLHGLIERKLSDAMRTPVRARILTGRGPDEPPPPDPVRAEVPASPGVPSMPPVPQFVIPESGMSNTQVWSAALDDLRTTGAITRANVDSWLRPAALIGREADGTLVVGTPHDLGQQRIARRMLGPLTDAISRIVGREIVVKVVTARAWLVTEGFQNGNADEDDSLRVTSGR